MTPQAVSFCLHQGRKGAGNQSRFPATSFVLDRLKVPLAAASDSGPLSRGIVEDDVHGVLEGKRLGGPLPAPFKGTLAVRLSQPVSSNNPFLWSPVTPRGQSRPPKKMKRRASTRRRKLGKRFVGPFLWSLKELPLSGVVAARSPNPGAHSHFHFRSVHTHTDRGKALAHPR